jgi:protein translocase SecG subunit
MSLLPYVQITLSVILVILVLLQHSDASAGGAFGQTDSAANTRTRRGGEKFIFIFTIVIAILFVLSAVIALLV